MTVVLPLESARWGELDHAYGSAEDIPRLLEALATIEGERERAELWFGAWNTLCPDGRVTTASFASAPHLLAVGDAHGAAEQVTALHAVAVIEMNRHLPGAAPIPRDLLEGYAIAIESLPVRVAALMAQPWDAATSQILTAVLLVGKRQPALARAVLELGAE